MAAYPLGGGTAGADRSLLSTRYATTWKPGFAGASQNNAGCVKKTNILLLSLPAALASVSGPDSLALETALHTLQRPSSLKVSLSAADRGNTCTFCANMRPHAPIWTKSQ